MLHHKTNDNGESQLWSQKSSNECSGRWGAHCQRFAGWTQGANTGNSAFTLVVVVFGSSARNFCAVVAVVAVVAAQFRVSGFWEAENVSR